MAAPTFTAFGTTLALAVAVAAPTVDIGTASVDSEIQAALNLQPDVQVDTASIPEGQVVVSGGAVSAPAAGGSEFELSLPLEGLNNLDASELSGDYSFAVAVKDEGDGAFRALFHIPDANAPAEYRFEVGDAFELIPLEDGGITVRDEDGDLAGVIATPWAFDASGVPVETEYAIDGNSVVQRIFTTSATTFPVVADPFWIPALMVMAHLTRHAVTQAAARGVSQALIKQVVQNGVRSAGTKGTSVFTQGKGANKIRVVVDDKTGNVITVTKG